MRNASSTPLVAWAVLIHEYYGVFLTPGRADMWRQELSLRENCGPGTTDAEIEAAVRFGLSKDFKAGPHGFLKDLVMLVRWYRKTERQARYGGEGVEACAHCHDGWLTVWPEPPDSPTQDDIMPGLHPASVPCLCARGRHWLATCKDYQGMSADASAALDALARRGMEQGRVRRRLVEEAGK
jgi:hypothetical protein